MTELLESCASVRSLESIAGLRPRAFVEGWSVTGKVGRAGIGTPFLDHPIGGLSNWMEPEMFGVFIESPPAHKLGAALNLIKMQQLNIYLPIALFIAFHQFDRPHPTCRGALRSRQWTILHFANATAHTRGKGGQNRLRNWTRNPDDHLKSLTRCG